MAGEETTKPVAWGLGDVALGFGIAYFLTIIFTPLVYSMTGQSLDTPVDELPLSTIALQQVPLTGGMLGVTLIASFYKGRGPVEDFGLRVRWRDSPFGAVIGVLTQFAATVLYLPLLWWTSVTSDDISGPAKDLTDKAHGRGGVILLIIVVGIAAPIVEEIFFRGLVLRAFERRTTRGRAVLYSSLLFGAAHLQPLQFPALFLFGLVAAVLTTRSGRLGPSMWAHVAFNLLAVSTLL